MSYTIKQRVLKKVYEAALKHTNLATHENVASRIVLGEDSSKGTFTWKLKLPLTFKVENDREFKSYKINTGLDLNNYDDELKFNFEGNNIVSIKVNSYDFVRDVLNSNPTRLSFEPTKSKTIVEYSSPNIAKPFHVGHLRSTIIGNFIGNLKSKFGKDVIRINYLGDWGTQIGMLNIGIMLSEYTHDDLKKDPIKLLLNAYVKAHEETAAHPEIFDKAKEIFKKLEDGDEECLNTWKNLQTWTVNELNTTYKRIGILFDEFSWESCYGMKEVNKILDVLNEQGLLFTDEKGRKSVTLFGNEIPLVKSDGTSLYLLRDLAALADRSSRYNFDEMFYVVDNGQSDHFRNLFRLSQDLMFHKPWGLHHIKFGAVKGMSTRSGKFTLLSDVLNESRDLMYERMVAAKTTKIAPNQVTADILGSTAIIVNDLKKKRLRDYEFNWEAAINPKYDGGVFLQYTHCRLCSILKNTSSIPAEDCDPEALLAPFVIELVACIALYEEKLLEAYAEFEACCLVYYLFNLCHCINKTVMNLKVKGSGEHVASQRLLLFKTAKMVLEDGMRLLGLHPLEEM